MAKTPSEPPFKGPWSELPPPEVKSRRPMTLRPPRRAAREPFIRNWRGLAIVVFLLFVAPWLANVVAHMILARMQGGGGF